MSNPWHKQFPNGRAPPPLYEEIPTGSWPPYPHPHPVLPPHFLHPAFQPRPIQPLFEQHQQLAMHLGNERKKFEVRLKEANAKVKEAEQKQKNAEESANARVKEAEQKVKEATQLVKEYAPKVMEECAQKIKEVEKDYEQRLKEEKEQRAKAEERSEGMQKEIDELRAELKRNAEQFLAVGQAEERAKDLEERRKRTEEQANELEERQKRTEERAKELEEHQKRTEERVEELDKQRKKAEERAEELERLKDVDQKEIEGLRAELKKRSEKQITEIQTSSSIQNCSVCEANNYVIEIFSATRKTCIARNNCQICNGSSGEIIRSEISRLRANSNSASQSGARNASAPFTSEGMEPSSNDRSASSSEGGTVNEHQVESTDAPVSRLTTPLLDAQSSSAAGFVSAVHSLGAGDRRNGRMLKGESNELEIIAEINVDERPPTISSSSPHGRCESASNSEIFSQSLPSVVNHRPNSPADDFDDRMQQIRNKIVQETGLPPDHPEVAIKVQKKMAELQLNAQRILSNEFAASHPTNQLYIPPNVEFPQANPSMTHLNLTLNPYASTNIPANLLLQQCHFSSSNSASNDASFLPNQQTPPVATDTPLGSLTRILETRLHGETNVQPPNLQVQQQHASAAKTPKKRSRKRKGGSMECDEEPSTTLVQNHQQQQQAFQQVQATTSSCHQQISQQNLLASQYYTHNQQQMIIPMLQNHFISATTHNQPQSGPFTQQLQSNQNIVQQQHQQGQFLQHHQQPLRNMSNPLQLFSQNAVQQMLFMPPQ